MHASPAVVALHRDTQNRLPLLQTRGAGEQICPRQCPPTAASKASSKGRSRLELHLQALGMVYLAGLVGLAGQVGLAAELAGPRLAGVHLESDLPRTSA